MNELQIFQNSEFGELSVLELDGKPYFPATACARILGYVNPQKAIRDHCKGVNEIVTPTNGGMQTMNFIPEGDLYRLITHSKLPAAERFEAWVFDEVLPAIRWTGGYGTQAPMMEHLVEQLAQATAALAQVDAIIAAPPVQEPKPCEPLASEGEEEPAARRRCKHRRKRKSMLLRLDGELLEQVDEMILSGDYSYVAIAEYLCGVGVQVSKSAIGRYAKLLDE